VREEVPHLAKNARSGPPDIHKSITSGGRRIPPFKKEAVKKPSRKLIDRTAKRGKLGA
jgi:hypothetical protein